MPDLSIEKLQLFILVILPGVIAMKVYDLFYPPAKRDFGSSILEVMAYGLISFALWSWLLVPMNQKDFIQRYPDWYAVGSIFFLVVFPAGLGYVIVLLRRTEWIAEHIGPPERTAWDDYFRRRQECWVLFHLKSGKMIGGFFGEKSYAPTFPQEPELYVEEVWRVNERGEFIEKVEGTLGMFVKLTECERLEFFKKEGK